MATFTIEPDTTSARIAETLLDNMPFYGIEPGDLASRITFYRQARPSVWPFRVARHYFRGDDMLDTISTDMAHGLILAARTVADKHAADAAEGNLS